MNWPGKAACCMLLSLLLVSPGRGEEKPAHPVRTDLKNVGRNLKREKRLLEKLRHRSTSLLETLSELDEEIRSSQEDLERAELHLADLGRQMAMHRKRREEATQALAKCRKRLAARLRKLYKLGENGWMEIVFGSQTVAGALESINLLTRRAREDSALIAEHERLKQVLAVSEREIHGRTARQQKMIEQVRKRGAETRAAREEKAHALELLLREEALHRRAVSELKKARMRLGRVISNIEGKSSRAKGFASWRGRLKSPVAGAEVEVPFGLREDARFKTVTRQQGVDLRAERGTSVKVVYPGKVVFARSFRGYGLTVIVDHGGSYYTLYAHLGRLDIEKGDELARGQVLGTVGDTGSLKGPYLYFEVREGGRAVNPERWVDF